MRPRFLLLSVPFLALVLGARSGAPLRAQAPRLALVGGTIYVNPTDTRIRDGVVLVEAGRIAAVGPRRSVRMPPGTKVIDTSGHTITAGFWNSHVHFQERKWANASNIPADELRGQLEAMLTRYGFTSVFDTGSPLANTQRLRDRTERGELQGPRIRTTGEILLPPGATPPDLVFDITGAMRFPLPEAGTAAEGLAASRRLLDAGADGVKMYAATWAPPIVALPPDALQAAVEEAHRRGKPVFAHPSNREGLLTAIRGGVDVLVHTAPQAGPWDAALVAEMRNTSVALIPTLKLWRYELRHDRASAGSRFVATAVSQLRGWLNVGGEVIFGTDVGYMNDYDPTDEYILVAEAGMSASQILASLTTTPAAKFGEEQRLGRIAPGFTADLVVLRGDPTTDVRTFAAVRYTIRDGAVIYDSGGR